MHFREFFRIINHVTIESLCHVCKIFAHKNQISPRNALLDILSAKILSTLKHDLMTVINAILMYALE